VFGDVKGMRKREREREREGNGGDEGGLASEMIFMCLLIDTSRHQALPEAVSILAEASLPMTARIRHCLYREFPR